MFLKLHVFISHLIKIYIMTSAYPPISTRAFVTLPYTQQYFAQEKAVRAPGDEAEARRNSGRNKRCLSPTIIALFGLLSPPAEHKKSATFALKPSQIDNLWYSNCRAADISPTPAASRHGRLHPKKNPSYTAPIAELPTHTKTPVSFAYRNTPKNSTAQSAATQKFTGNALQISQSYSYS